MVPFSLGLGGPVWAGLHLSSEGTDPLVPDTGGVQGHSVRVPADRSFYRPVTLCQVFNDGDYS